MIFLFKNRKFKYENELKIAFEEAIQMRNIKYDDNELYIYVESERLFGKIYLELQQNQIVISGTKKGVHVSYQITESDIIFSKIKEEIERTIKDENKLTELKRQIKEETIQTTICQELKKIICDEDTLPFDCHISKDGKRILFFRLKDMVKSAFIVNDIGLGVMISEKTKDYRFFEINKTIRAGKNWVSSGIDIENEKEMTIFRRSEEFFSKDEIEKILEIIHDKTDYFE